MNSVELRADEGMIADLESEVADLIGAGGSNASDRDSCTASSSSGCDSPRYRRQSRHVLEWHVAEASLGTSRRRKRVLKNIKVGPLFMHNDAVL
jgi:hypothetical protein